MLFWSNYDTNLYNDEKLKYVSAQISTGENVDSIELMTVPNSTYSPCMPYNEEFEYIDNWMHKYYEIPENVSIYWIQQ